MSHRVTPKILLVGWDAADWRIIHPLMDAGKMPCLTRLVERGSMSNLATLQPALSPMLWTTIATGKHAHKHGVHGFAEPQPDGQGIRPITSYARKTKAIWNILSQVGLSSNVIGWWPSHPAEPIRGTMVSNHFQHAAGPPDVPWATPEGAVHPPRLTKVLAKLRLNPNELWAEHIRAFIPRAAEIDQARDRRLASCAKILAECVSVHSIATWLMRHEPWDLTAVYFDAIDHFSHGFMPYHPPRQAHISAQDFELYQGVVEAAYQFHDSMLETLVRMAGPDTVIILISDHGFHSNHLRPILTPAVPAGPASEHRDLGVFVIHGPGICRDKLLHGLSILDVAPTVLTLFGLPVGEDMDGSPITEAMCDPPESIATLHSWDDVEGNSGMHPPELRIDSNQEQQALQQLVDLGYISPPNESSRIAVDGTLRELQYNLGRSYMQDEQFAQALKQFEQLYQRRPDEYRFGLQLALCHRALGNSRQMRVVVDDLCQRRQADAANARSQLRLLLRQIRTRIRSGNTHSAQSSSCNDGSDRHSDVTKFNHEETLSQDQLSQTSATDRATACCSMEEMAQIWELRSRAHYNAYAVEYLQGCVSIEEQDYDAALEHFRRAAESTSTRPGLHLQIGAALLELGRTEDSEKCFQQALRLDPQNPHAHLGLARCNLLHRKNQQAVEFALKATGIIFHFPAAHYYLGIALERIGRIAAALSAYKVALSLNPNFAAAHQRLASIYRFRLGDEDAAIHHESESIQKSISGRKLVS